MSIKPTSSKGSTPEMPSPTSSQSSVLSATESVLLASLDEDPRGSRQSLMNVIGDQAREIARLQIIIARHELKERQGCLSAILGRLANAVEDLVKTEAGGISQGLEELVEMFAESREAIEELGRSEAKMLGSLVGIL